MSDGQLFSGGQLVLAGGVSVNVHRIRFPQHHMPVEAMDFGMAVTMRTRSTIDWNRFQLTLEIRDETQNYLHEMLRYMPVPSSHRPRPGEFQLPYPWYALISKGDRFLWDIRGDRYKGRGEGRWQNVTAGHRERVASNMTEIWTFDCGVTWDIYPEIFYEAAEQAKAKQADQLKAAVVQSLKPQPFAKPSELSNRSWLDQRVREVVKHAQRHLV